MRTVGTRKNVVFLDFEASSLEQGSFPIEIGWCDATGHGVSYLIQPEPTWTEWSPASQQIHGISREQLAAKGLPAADVARKARAVLDASKAVVFSDAPAFDQFWLDMLLKVDGGLIVIPRLLDLTQLLAMECRVMLEANSEPPETPQWHRENQRIRDRIFYIIGSVEEAYEGPRAHRAQADAERCWRVWQDVVARVRKETRR